jgi:carboxylesterase type B
MDHTIINDGNNIFGQGTLFKGVMMDSGQTIPALPVDSDKANAVYNAMVTATNCQGLQNYTCMQNANIALFQSAQSIVSAEYNLPIAYVPRPDPSSAFFRTSPEIALAQGKFAKVPIMVGAQQDDGTFFAKLALANGTVTVSNMKAFFDLVCPNASPSEIDALLAAYDFNDPASLCPYNTGTLYNQYPYTGYKYASAIIGDVIMVLARRVYLSLVSEYVNAWTWIGDYDHELAKVGTTHGTDLLEQFYGLNGGPLMPYHTRFRLISFINYLNPNTLPLLQKENLYKDWPTWTSDSPNVLQFNIGNYTLIQDTFRAPAYEALKAGYSNFAF